MNNKFYSVDEISALLDMHPKTVQRYIREGKMKATKVGKAWRVLEKDFRTFMNLTGDQTLLDSKREVNKIEPYDRIKVSSVVDITVDSSDDAINIANMLTATLNGKDKEYGKTSLNIQFIEPESKLRVMLWGNVKFMETMMSFMSDYMGKYME